MPRVGIHLATLNCLLVILKFSDRRQLKVVPNSSMMSSYFYITFNTVTMCIQGILAVKLHNWIVGNLNIRCLAFAAS